MAQTTTCPRCGDTGPADALFCITCGAAMAEAATGPTVKLNGSICNVCQTPNPKDARFCVACGQPMAQDAAPQPPLRPYRPSPVRPAPRVYPRIYAPPTMVPRQHVPAPRHGPHPAMLLVVLGIIFLVATKSLWPGILPLLLIGYAVSRVASGRSLQGLVPVIMVLGLLFLLMKGLFWPGILVFWVLSWMLGGWGHWRHW